MQIAFASKQDLRKPSQCCFRGMLIKVLTIDVLEYYNLYPNQFGK